MAVNRNTVRDSLPMDITADEEGGQLLPLSSIFNVG